MRRETVLGNLTTQSVADRVSLRVLAVWFARHRARARLRSLDTHLMQDAGLDADQVRTECRKWFWQA